LIIKQTKCRSTCTTSSFILPGQSFKNKKHLYFRKVYFKINSYKIVKAGFSFALRIFFEFKNIYFFSEEFEAELFRVIMVLVF
jgi:hypothetical protein